MTIYQPRTLNLSKGTEIQTREGKYTTQLPETWYSMGAYKELEDIVIKR